MAYETDAGFDNKMSLSCKIDGKLYRSPYEYENKYSFNTTVKMETELKNEDDKIEKMVADVTAKTVCVKGETYTKTTAKVETDGIKGDSVSYDKGDFDFGELGIDGVDIGSLYEQIFEMVEDSEIIVNLLESADLDNSDIYLSDDKIEMSYEIEELAPLKNEMRSQYIVDLDKDGVNIKSFDSYSYMYSENEVYDGECDSETATNLVVMKMSFKKASFGIINRPSDYYKYN